MLQKQIGPLWVVVEVYRGIPVGAEAYSDVQFAVEREQFLRKHIHPEDDETGIFEVWVDEVEPDQDSIVAE